MFHELLQLKEHELINTSVDSVMFDRFVSCQTQSTIYLHRFATNAVQIMKYFVLNRAYFM